MLRIIFAATLLNSVQSLASAPSEELGKKLFFDPRLSVDGTVSCNSCHNTMLGGEDNRAFSAGVKGQLGGRSSPTVWNSKFNSVFFWDGRAASLEEQAKGPLTNPVEMGMPSHATVVERLKSLPGYQSEFAKVFGKKNPVTIDNVAKAIADFERTLIATDSPYDRYMKGNKKALNDAQIAGMKTFESTGCVACHSGENFNGPKLNDGIGFFMKFPTFENNDYVTKYGFKKDTGRYEVTKNENDKHMWRVPTLRNVAMTAPYFHNGSVKTLDQAVKVMAKVQLNKDLSDSDTKSITIFLESLTSPTPQIVAPRLPIALSRTLTPD